MSPHYKGFRQIKIKEQFGGNATLNMYYRDYEYFYPSLFTVADSTELILNGSSVILTDSLPCPPD
jgi:hypothetical protein